MTISAGSLAATQTGMVLEAGTKSLLPSLGAGEMAHELRTLSALLGDLGLIPSTHKMAQS